MSSESEPPSLFREPRRDLSKHKSWSPDIHRDETWENRRRKSFLRRGRSVTDDDLDELRGCLDLGFDFEPEDVDQKLSSTFPALELFCAVKRSYSSGSSSRSTTTSFSEIDSASSPRERQVSIVDAGDEPEAVKTKLKQWAQVVACTVQPVISPKSLRLV